ncbi:MAG: ABC transporter permease [Acutalibacteraceae bacterium]
MLWHADTIIDQFNNTISSMQAIVVVIVLTAGALAFVVLYNLTNINIEERVREIATIKVLGVNMKETISYVFRENIILTLLGIAIGLGLGTIMTDFVVNIIELDLVMFGRGVSWISYVGSVLITLVFAILVMVVMSFKVRKIDMIESLKSNE